MSDAAHCATCVAGQNCNGACPCPHDGRDIVRHLQVGYCPHPDGPLFGAGEKPAGFDVLTPAELNQGKPPPPLAPARRDPEPLPDPVPLDRWPWAARAIRTLRKDRDRGVGDTIERLLGEGGEFYKRLAKRLGHDCNCEARRDRLNAMYAYIDGGGQRLSHEAAAGYSE